MALTLSTWSGPRPLPGPRRVAARAVAVRGDATSIDGDWRAKSKPIPAGSNYPAQEHCSHCGLCDTYFVAHVKDACAFLGSGMSDVEAMEERVHGRKRNDDLFGVVDENLYARVVPEQRVAGAQWTGVVTSVAVRALETGTVDAVVCVQSQDADKYAPKPVVATTAEEIIKARGVKPSLSSNLEVLATLEGMQVRPRHP